MSAVFRLHCQSALKSLFRPSVAPLRAISTSKKNRDTATVADAAPCAPTVATKNWVSYGFDKTDEKADRQVTHAVMFLTVTLVMVFGGFIWTYMPDYQLRDWAQREAYLELRRREKAGRPLIDRNLVDPLKVKLPTDKELGSTEIII